MMKLLLGACAVSLALAGCSEPAPSAPQITTATTQSVTVQIADSVPLDIYYNLDDASCYSESALEGSAASAPVVIVRDEADVIIARVDAPEVFPGFELDGVDGCLVRVDIDNLPPAEFYTVEVMGPDGLAGSTVVEGLDEAVIRVDL